MLVRCPKCRAEFRLVDLDPAERIVRYLCPACDEIVQVDLSKDEVRSTSSSSSYHKLERRKTVLVADDCAQSRNLARELLDAAGFDVVGARDGAEALREARERRPDLLVVDLLMPERNGFEVLRELREDDATREIPVLAMHGSSRERLAGYVAELGAAELMDKGAMRQSLVALARRLLDPEPEPEP